MSASWKTVRVFISSTFKDMQAERDHLVRFVFPKLREELLPHRIHFVDVDLRWGLIVTRLVSRRSPPCMALVQRLTPLYKDCE